MKEDLIKLKKKVFYAILSEANCGDEIENNDIRRPFKLSNNIKHLYEDDDLTLKNINDILDLCENLELPYLINGGKYNLKLYMKETERELNSINSIDLRATKKDLIFQCSYKFYNPQNSIDVPQFIYESWDYVYNCEGTNYSFKICSDKILTYLEKQDQYAKDKINMMDWNF